MENEPEQPDSKPDPADARTGTNGTQEHGIPSEAVHDEAKGSPSGDRHQSEVSPAKT